MFFLQNKHFIFIVSKLGNIDFKNIGWVAIPDLAQISTVSIHPQSCYLKPQKTAGVSSCWGA